MKYLISLFFLLTIAICQEVTISLNKLQPGSSVYTGAIEESVKKHLIPAQKKAELAVKKLKVLSELKKVSRAQKQKIELLKKDLLLFQFWQTYVNFLIKTHNERNDVHKTVSNKKYFRYASREYYKLTETKFPDPLLKTELKESKKNLSNNSNHMAPPNSLSK